MPRRYPAQTRRQVIELACSGTKVAQFDSLMEVQVLAEDWRIDYNTHRPYSAHGQLTPSEFAQRWTATHQPQLA